MVMAINPGGLGPIPTGMEAADRRNSGAIEEGSRKQQKDTVGAKKSDPTDLLYAQVIQSSLLEQSSGPTASLEIARTPQMEEIDEAAFSEIIGEMKGILEQEVDLFGQVLEKSILDSLHKKLKTLENRLYKKMISEIFQPDEKEPPPETPAPEDLP